MVTSRRWIPDRGDLIWLTFTPQAGREQAGAVPRGFYRRLDWRPEGRSKAAFWPII
jgi:hypothetical protein